jgi:hypothetical protein
VRGRGARRAPARRRAHLRKVQVVAKGRHLEKEETQRRRGRAFLAQAPRRRAQHRDGAFVPPQRQAPRHDARRREHKDERLDAEKERQVILREVVEKCGEPDAWRAKDTRASARRHRTL